MTANQTLGYLAASCDLQKIRAEVKTVESDGRFAALRKIIEDIVAQGKSSGVSEADLRDNALVLAMNINLEFRLAVSQQLLKAHQAGNLK
jgi:hypothetical protein